MAHRPSRAYSTRLVDIRSLNAWRIEMKSIFAYSVCMVLILAMIPVDLVRLGLGKLLYGGEVK